MKKLFRIIMWCAVAVCVLKACHMNYVCDVVSNIPPEIRNRIIEEHPECMDLDLLARFWETKGDSLVSEIAQEQEYERELIEYLRNHPEDNN